MDLVRLATIRLSAPPPRAVAMTPYAAVNGVIVHVHSTDGTTDGADLQPGADGNVVVWPYEHDKVRVAVSATVAADPAPRLDGDRLVVPRGAREAAEAAIGEFSDVLAVTHQCRRALRSPTPAVALVPGPGDPPACARASGLAQDWPVRSSARLMPSTDPAQLAHSLRDRPDGVQMLADALAEDSAVARARELFRLFERAFAKGPSGCVGPLSEFLAAGPRHDASVYSREEVAGWMQQLRPLAVHGDRRRAHARSADAAPYIARMEWAAYDVLLHKSVWHGPLPDRRPLLTLAAVPAQDGSGTILLARGAAVAIDHLDAYGVWPVDWEARVQPPDTWIWRLPGQDAD